MAESDTNSLHRTLLRREESYAIHALVYAAENPGSAAAQIASDLQMPPAFLAKVLRRLAQVGYVENRQGRNGGVTLTADPAKLTLLDIIEAVSGPVILDTCQTKARCATQQRKGYCRINVCWINTTLAIHEALSAVKLEELIDKPRPRVATALGASA
ncbi:MAG: Rrf2 family transcriptional regulator [Trueperaceae bacterium]